MAAKTFNSNTIIRKWNSIRRINRHRIDSKSTVRAKRLHRWRRKLESLHLARHRCHPVRTTAEWAPAKMTNWICCTRHRYRRWAALIEDIGVRIHRQGECLCLLVFVVVLRWTCSRAYPSRYNRGQSPLLLRRNLLDYGNQQVAPSPSLPRRWVHFQ